MKSWHEPTTSTRPDDIATWQRLAPRIVDEEDWARFESYVTEILTSFGMNPATPGTYDTPRRFLQALYDSTAGYEGDPNLMTVFPAEGRSGNQPGQIVEGPITFHALCEHHALPFHGSAYVGYVAGDRIIGISKLTRLVRLFARRFTVQERMGEQIADAFTEALAPQGVAVKLEAAHLCTQLRGVREERSKTVTTFWRGCYDDAELRREFLHEARDRGGSRD